jgi:protein-S-isoprenylcysteine O-methyltransferase Ste14
MLLLRAFISFLVLPGVVAGLVPALIVTRDVHRGPGSDWGWALLVPGFCLLLWCVRDFYVSGRGTLAPWDPPRRLVIVGLYRRVRNPMYVSVLTLLLGWSLAAGSVRVAGYAAVVVLIFHLRVIYYEEPHLRKLFGAEWTAYAASVPRWLPRLRVTKG